VSGLQFDHASEEVEPGEGGLAALPAEDGLGHAVAEELGDHRFEDLVDHRLGAAAVGVEPAGEQLLRAVVEAILAAQVAAVADRLDQQLKLSHRSVREQTPITKSQ